MTPRIQKKVRYIFNAEARILTVVFALLLALPAISSFYTDDTARSHWENRPLARLPAPLGSENNIDFFDGLDQYLNDHFGFALELNRLYRKLSFYVFNDSPSSDITLGKDGFVFVTSFKSAPFSVLETLCVRGTDPKEAKLAVNSWTRILNYFSLSHRNAALIIVPSKPTLYAEKLPLNVPLHYREACAQYKFAYSASRAIALSALGTQHTVIYPYNEFLAQKYQANFYPQENFHYSGDSAHWLGRETLNRLGITVDSAYEEKIQSTVVTHDLKNLLGFTRKAEITTYPYSQYFLQKKKRIPEYVTDYFARAWAFGTILNNNPLSQRTALVIGNSFTPFTVDHLAPGYRSLTYIMLNSLQEDEYAEFFTKFVPRFGADDLIFVFNDNVATYAARPWVAELDKNNAW